MTPQRQARLEAAIAVIRTFGRANASAVAQALGLSKNVAGNLLHAGYAAGRLTRCDVPGFYEVRDAPSL